MYNNFRYQTKTKQCNLRTGEASLASGLCHIDLSVLKACSHFFYCFCVFLCILHISSAPRGSPSKSYLALPPIDSQVASLSNNEAMVLLFRALAILFSLAHLALCAEDYYKVRLYSLSLKGCYYADFRSCWASAKLPRIKKSSRPTDMSARNTIQTRTREHIVPHLLSIFTPFATVVWFICLNCFVVVGTTKPPRTNLLRPQRPTRFLSIPSLVKYTIDTVTKQ